MKNGFTNPYKDYSSLMFAMDDENVPIESRQQQRKLSRTHNWYSKQSPPVRIMLVIGILVILLLILEGVLLMGLYVESLKGGMAVFVEPEHGRIEIPLGNTMEVSFDISVQNLPLCKAICDWEIKRHDTNEVVSSGRDAILSGTTHTMSIMIEGGTERKEYPVTFAASCQNEVERHCQRNTGPNIARTSTIVTFADTPEARTAREYLEGEGRLRLVQRQELAADLEAISQLQTGIIPTIKSSALAQSQMIQLSLDETRIAYENDNPIRARAILEEPVNGSVYERYMEAVRIESETIDSLARAASSFRKLSAIAQVASESDRDSIIALTSTIRLLSTRVNTTDIFQTKTQIEQAETSIRRMIQQYEPGLMRDSEDGLKHAREEHEAMCRIKEYDCQEMPIIRTPNSSIDALQNMKTACNTLSKLNELHTNANEHYARLLHPNMSLYEVEALYNVSALRTEAAFLEFESEAIRTARQGKPINATARERLAIRLDALSGPAFAFSSKCNFNLEIDNSEPAIPQKSLPSALETRVIRERLTFPAVQCCTFAECTPCEPSQMYPVIFIHGHSFAESSLPEYNIQAFTKIALALEEHGYLYAGNIFPQTRVPEERIGLFRNVQNGVIFTSTYYYDSFEEDKKSQIAPRKSENIETYALRLREAIDATLKTADSDKVIIVAHSMGGLVARSYMATFGEEKVAGLIMIGTPNRGVADEVGLLCPVFGSNKECEDLKQDSFFLRKLSSYPAPRIPIMTIAGQGCKDGPHDGLVAVDSVQLDYARNEIINGSCASRMEMLHGMMLKPDHYPKTLELISEFLNQTGTKR
jgi:pimeloyl-ACP methyl ester carboxylesterase